MASVQRKNLEKKFIGHVILQFIPHCQKMYRPIKKRAPEGTLPELSLKEMCQEDLDKLIYERDKLQRQLKYVTNSYECETKHHEVHYKRLKEANDSTRAYQNI